MRHPRFLLSVCAVVALIAVAPALAQTPPSSDDAVTAQARRLHNEGDALFEKGNFDKARAAYLAAWALKRHYQIAGALGAAEVKLGLYRDAAEHLAYFIRTSPSDDPPSAEAKQLFVDVLTKVCKLDMTVDVEGAEITLDGKLVGTSPLDAPLFLEPGRHMLNVRYGAKLVTQRFDVMAGEAKQIATKFEEPDAEPPTPSGPSLPLEQQRDETRSSFHPNRWIIAGGAAGTAVSLGLGIFFAVNAGAVGDTANAQLEEVHRGPICKTPPQTGPCANLVDLRSQYDTWINLRTGMFITAGVLAVGTAVYAFWPWEKGGTQPKASSAALQEVVVTPLVGPQQGVMLVQGKF